MRRPDPYWLAVAVASVCAGVWTGSVSVLGFTFSFLFLITVWVGTLERASRRRGRY